MADPLSVAGTAVGIVSLGIVVTKGLIDYYKAFRDLNDDVTQTSRKLSHLLTLLEKLHTQLEEHPSRLENPRALNTLRDSAGDCKQLIVEFQSELDKLQKHPQSKTNSALRSIGRRLAYPLRKSTLQKLDEGVDEFVLCASFALQLMVQSDTAKARSDIDDVRDLLHLVRATQVASDIRAWLKAPDPSSDFNEIAKKRHTETGVWFVEGLEFKQWLEKPCSFLWLVGFAGCGKSVLCSTVIQYTFRHRCSRHDVGLAFFFFAFDDQRKCTASSMLRSLILQLSSQLGYECSPLLRLRNIYQETCPPDQELIQCLHELVLQFTHVYIALDGLDESPRETHRDAVLETLAQFRKWAVPGFHLIVTSRDAVDIREGLSVLPEEIVRMRNTCIDSDITLFISQTLRDSPGLQKWKEHHHQIEQVLTQKAQGVFRWVECQFRALSVCPQSQDLLEKLLQSLPRNLEDTYEAMLRSIPPHCADYAHQMLTLLCCAMRPLSVEELVDGMAIELGDSPSFNLKRRLSGGSDAIQLICPGFTQFAVDLESHLTTVRIAHFSVQEYLQSDQLSQSKDLSHFGVRKRHAEDQVTCICLTMLLEPTLSISQQALDSFFSPRKANYPLASYAARYWPHHYSASHQGTSTSRQVLSLFMGNEFKRWVKIWDIDNLNSGNSAYLDAGRLYYASRLGLIDVCRELMRQEDMAHSYEDSNVNSTAGYYGTALQAASVQGHTEIVQLLLENGADVNIKAGYFGTALQAASTQGNVEIARLLLSVDKYINNTTPYHGHALQAAAVEGHSEIISLFFLYGIDVDFVCGQYGTALQAASAEGDTCAVRMLLEHGADINKQSGYFGTALQAASAKWNTETVKLLLAKGANVNCEAGHYGSALQAASVLSSLEIVGLLLDARAHVDHICGFYGTPLQAASGGGRFNIVKLLIEKGANVNTQGGLFGTALQAASANGHADVVQLLLDQNARIDIEGGHYGSALRGALEKGNSDIATLLSDKQAHELGHETSKVDPGEKFSELGSCHIDTSEAETYAYTRAYTYYDYTPPDETQVDRLDPYGSWETSPSEHEIRLSAGETGSGYFMQNPC
ncbi:unnamed protein product [Clonostachys solani]|uniref:NACHT domain-containing protein n=1 Tax=Clonostachys solani TaxID=160281 RepID=A0A9N9Z8V5_9HYPO|nr:unnamed protein product [Clonostachys solani]